MWRQAPWNDAGRCAAMLSRGQGTGARLKYKARPSRARSALTQLGSRNSRNDWIGAAAVLISLPAVSRNPCATRATTSAGIIGSSPCRLTTISSAANPLARTVSATRSVPET